MTQKRFNCHVKFSAMPNGIMVLDYERHGEEQIVIEDISREKAHKVRDRLNELNDENEQLKSREHELALEINGLVDENEQLKQALGSILIEVKQEFSASHKAGEVRAFINPRSYDLISDVLRRYGALKGWYDD